VDEWTLEDVAQRFAEAARTAERLPGGPRLDARTYWPEVVRSSHERMAAEDVPPPRIPATPQQVQRMLEVMHWVRWLEVEQRHLVWMRAQRWGWPDIARRFGCDRSTVWRRWQRALQIVAARLNDPPEAKRASAR
jgi:DNA-directed RNA polymerase specialized sigma24 family protein